MTTLHNDPAYVDDIVFDAVDGPGTIKAVSKNCLHVQFGKCGIKKYTRDGFTGKRCRPTLFWHNPYPIVFAKNACHAALQNEILKTNLQLMNTLIKADCPDDGPNCYTDDDCCPEPQSCIPPDPCETETIKILKMR